MSPVPPYGTERREMLRVYADERERRSGVPEILAKKYGVIVTFKNMPVADYAVSDRVGIERKSVSDFLKSLADGRLFNQARRLKEVYQKPFIIVEGKWDWVEKAERTSKAASPALASLVYDFGIGIIYTLTKEDTARVIKFLAEREQGENKRRVPVKLQGKPPIGDVRQWQLFLVQCLPGVGPKLAEKLLERFGSVRAVFNASVAELSKVEGLGTNKAQEIVKVLTAPWKIRKDKEGLEKFIKKEDS
ncbi:ERCC4 domain protein [Ignicoccus hospitalis KIN4/I]|uniref:ERCC4 domain protein n=2 Tax=Ignicoccus TaxID=54258 RepID=A8ABD8_IGNH4|nr:ERCC4 domain protein [Ignicoccus hospitalis KIN4/I]